MQEISTILKREVKARPSYTEIFEELKTKQELMMPVNKSDFETANLEGSIGSPSRPFERTSTVFNFKKYEK